MKNHGIKSIMISLAFGLSAGIGLYGQSNQPNITTVSKPCALIINPTSDQIEKMAKKDGDDFYTIADDNNYYIGMIRLYLDSVKAETINREAEGKVKFKLSDGRIHVLELQKLYWNVFLFNGKDLPLKIDITDFDSQYKKYMRAGQ